MNGIGEKLLKVLIVSIACLFLAFSPLMPRALATGVYDMPSWENVTNTWVVDEGEVLSRITEGTIGSQFEELAKKTGNQVRFVTIRRLDYGETVKSFTDKLFDLWFPTPEAGANQAVLVLDTITNDSAVHLGSQIKLLLGDTITDSLTNETVQIPLKNGNKYNEVLLGASNRLFAVLSGETDPGPPKLVENIEVEATFKSAEETDTNSATIIVVVLLILATVIPMVTYFYYQRSA